MRYFKNTFISSTFWTERVGPTAAIATLKEMKRIKSWEHVSKYGKYIKNEWKKMFDEHLFDVEINGLDSMPLFNFLNKKNQLFKSYITLEMLKRGYLATNSVYVSTAHTPKLIKKYLQNFNEVLKNLRDQLNSKKFRIKYLSEKQINR